jgi:hypothetical protein
MLWTLRPGACRGRALAAWVGLASFGLLLVACERKSVDEHGPTTPTPQVRVLPSPIAPIGAQPGGPARPTPSPPSEPASPAPGATPVPEDVPNNDAPVTRVDAKVFFVECDGQVIPNSGYATSARVGCRVHLDATPKDSGGRPTRARGAPSWAFTGTPGIYAVNDTADYTPTLTVLAAGSLGAFCTIDGVTSNPVGISFQ